MYIYTFDFETDPFKVDRIPEPFCVGWCDGHDTYNYWGTYEECVDVLVSAIMTSPEGSIWYAHNGGKFDAHFLLKFIDSEKDIICIGARIVEMHIGGRAIRDSYAVLPVPLDKYKKLDFDYKKMERDVREQHKEEILRYLDYDCEALHEFISSFIEEFGLHLTMAGAAIKQLRKFHKYQKIQSDKQDAEMRRFYFGGRVQCFKSGVMSGDWSVYDVNSMYPSVMVDYEHPVGKDVNYVVGKAAIRMIERCDFAIINAYSNGVLPWRDEKGSLRFEPKRGTFYASGFEIRAGLESGNLTIFECKQAWRCSERTNFKAFIEHFYNARLEAKRDGKDAQQLFYKLIMNSAYGKFAQNPDDFREYRVSHDKCLDHSEGWILEHTFPDQKTMIYSRPSPKPSYLGRINVMTAASITAAARARLYEGLLNSENPVYCDTDSVICEGFSGRMDPKKLGYWDCEAQGSTMAIAGKKLYCLLDENGDEVKKASKGVRIPVEDIIKVADGGEVFYEQEAPTFSLKRDTRFVKRTIRKT